MDLWHGPTSAFKDIALTILPASSDGCLSERKTGRILLPSSPRPAAIPARQPFPVFRMSRIRQLPFSIRPSVYPLFRNGRCRPATETMWKSLRSKATSMTASEWSRKLSLPKSASMPAGCDDLLRQLDQYRPSGSPDRLLLFILYAELVKAV